MNNTDISNNDIHTDEIESKNEIQENIGSNEETTNNDKINTEQNDVVNSIEIINKDKFTERDNIIDLQRAKDVILDMTILDNTLLPQNIGRQKQQVWVYSQYFTKHLWQQGHQRQLQQQQQQLHQQQPKPYTDMWTQHAGGGRRYSGNEFDAEPLMYDPYTRNIFVRLVMSITLVMLVITAAIIIYILHSPDMKYFILRNGSMLLILALGVYMIPNYGMMCCPIARRLPCSIVMLLLTMFSMTTMAAFVSCYYGTEIVLYATIATTAIVFACLILACTSFDFTLWFLYVVVISVGLSVVALIVLGASLISGMHMTPMRIFILVIGVILQAVFLVMELQMILGGRSLELAEDDYSLAAFMLYTSIVDIFIKMVQILGLSGSS